jgi:hypothetical protein
MLYPRKSYENEKGAQRMPVSGRTEEKGAYREIDEHGKEQIGVYVFSSQNYVYAVKP